MRAERRWRLWTYLATLNFADLHSEIAHISRGQKYYGTSQRRKSYVILLVWLGQSVDFPLFHQRPNASPVYLALELTVLLNPSE